MSNASPEERLAHIGVREVELPPARRNGGRAHPAQGAALHPYGVQVDQTTDHVALFGQGPASGRRHRRHLGPAEMREVLLGF